ncbi:hypothetical protein E3W21_25105 [Pseudomonas sp. F01002]|nr:hypothetical protein E3W21_25105 [Pseudomonas sp. F01002]
MAHDAGADKSDFSHEKFLFFYVAPCRSCRRLRSFDLDLDLERQSQKIAAFGSSYRDVMFG